MMTAEAWLTLAVTALLLYVLARELGPPDVVFVAAVVVLALAGVITPEEAFGGFANSGVLMIGALFVVAAALRETGVMDYVGQRFLGRAKTELAALAAIAGVCLAASAFLNNTPIVAMLLPVVIDWCRKRSVSPSRLLIPLSFLTILGGACTLIGTSTNQVVHGMMLKEGLPGMSFFEVGFAGLPCAVIGTVYVLTVGRWLLPERKELMEQLGESRREYLVEMLVQPDCRLIGQSVEQAGLRQLPGLFLIEIERQGRIIGPVGPAEVIESGDRLVFTGVVSTIVDLKKIPGLVPAADEAYEVTPRRTRGRMLCEAVISPTSPLIGKNIRGAEFRTHYNAAVVAVHRNGERLTNKIGDIVLRPGDTLLLQTGSHFIRAQRNNPDFYLVSNVEDSRPLRHDRARIALLLFFGLVAAMASGWVNPTLAAFAAAGLMVAARCISTSDARRAVEWSVLVTIAASFGLSTALVRSGAAATLAGHLVDLTRALGPVATLAAIYFVTMVLNEVITNNAAAALAFPFGLEAARLLGVNERPLLIAVALAASFAFSSPIGYQTHMMVYGPGGYRFTDFLKVGLPLNLLLWGAAVLLIPFWWPWHG
jgi:di/tricarboxylate transporter